jgi:hypothetical protein
MANSLNNAVTESDKYRDTAKPAGGSLAATMNQGGAYSYASGDSLSETMNQGGSTKRGNKLQAVPLRRPMNQ